MRVVPGLPKASVWAAASSPPGAGKLGLTSLLCGGAGGLAQPWFGLGGFLFPLPSE